MSKKSSRKAVRVVRHTLADGTTKEYTYPRHRARKRVRRGDTIGDLIAAWQSSPEWNALKPSTQAGYARYIMPLLNMQHVDARKLGLREIIENRNAMVRAKGRGAATAFIRSTSAMFGWARENGWVEQSPVYRIKRLPGGTLPAWSESDLALALASLPEHLRRPVILAIFTGQRRSDLIAMPWNAYNGRTIRVTQVKTGTPLVLPVHPALRAELDAWRGTASSTMILTNKFGRPWLGSNLSNQLKDALREIDGFPPKHNIHGLRKLAAARLAEAGCTIHEIGAITGHRSLDMLRLYTESADQERLATAAIVRLVKGGKD